MFNLNQTPGRTAMVNGKECLFFSGYSYLGMSHVPEFVELIKEGIDKHGWLFPSSRISNTQLDLFAEFELKLSEITGMEETVCFSSGFLAGRAVADLFIDQEFSIAPGTHPAIGLKKNIHGSFDEWTLKATSSSIILFDSVNPLTAEINDTSFLNSLDAKTVVIDDSHGAGMINDGRGIIVSAKHNLIITYSLSKAYNLIGGAVSCSKQVARQLKSSAFYAASTSISPAFVYAFLNGQDLYQQQREHLKKNMELFCQLTGKKFTSHSELPIFILPSSFDVKRLTDKGLIISSFAYPDPLGSQINRIIINALHTAEDLEYLVANLNM